MSVDFNRSETLKSHKFWKLIKFPSYCHITRICSLSIIELRACILCNNVRENFRPSISKENLILHACTLSLFSRKQMHLLCFILSLLLFPTICTMRRWNGTDMGIREATGLAGFCTTKVVFFWSFDNWLQHIFWMFKKYLWFKWSQVSFNSLWVCISQYHS